MNQRLKTDSGYKIHKRIRKWNNCESRNCVDKSQQCFFVFLFISTSNHQFNSEIQKKSNSKHH